MSSTICKFCGSEQTDPCQGKNEAFACPVSDHQASSVSTPLPLDALNCIGSPVVGDRQTGKIYGCHGAPYGEPSDKIQFRGHLLPQSYTDIIGVVNQWNLDAGRTQGYFNPRQAAFYLGMQCEELAEKLAACGLEISAEVLDHLGKELKQGTWDAQVAAANRKTLLDGDADLVVVSIGSAQGVGSDFHRAMEKVLAANEAKRFPGGQLHKDANGKILKPKGWTAPDLTDCLRDWPKP